MTTLENLRETMTAFLKKQGVEAMSAWPSQRSQVPAVPLAVVQIKQMEAGPAGFQNYLGQQYDEKTGHWTERYGQKMTVSFLIELYSPESRGESGCRALLDLLADALQEGGPDGLTVEKWSMGGTDFDTASGLFRGTVRVVCRTVLVALSDEYGAFLGFEVKGGIQA